MKFLALERMRSLAFALAPITAAVMACASCASNGVPADTGIADAAPASVLCMPCAVSQNCNHGPPGPNLCVADRAGRGSFCGTACAGSADCPPAFACTPVQDHDGGVVGTNCLPEGNRSCGLSDPDAAVDPVSAFLCESCVGNADCNVPGFAGNFCLRDPGGGGACGTECMAPSDCPSGTTCYSVMDRSGMMAGGACFPADGGSCKGFRDGG